MNIICTSNIRRALSPRRPFHVSLSAPLVLVSMSSKRREPPAGNVSPPSSKRKIESTTTAASVTNFFKPASQKEPDHVTWRTVENSLLVGRYTRDKDEEQERSRTRRRRIAAFDLDGTLTKTASGNVHSRTGTDWRWWDPSVPKALRALDKDGYQIVVVSNQGGINLIGDPKSIKSDRKRLSDFKERVGSVLKQLDLPISVYAATMKDRFRKPRIGMWKELLEDYDLDVGDGPDLAGSIFVGDAGGRIADKALGVGVDFASSDRDFAANTGINFKTPEEFFLEQPARVWERKFDPTTFLSKVSESTLLTTVPGKVFEKKNAQDIVILCGSPASGKSTFYWRYLAPLGYERVNQDILKTRDKCLKKAEEALGQGQSVAVDNTNADIETRNHWLTLAKNAKVPIRCIWLRADPRICEHNDTVRALNNKMNPEQRELLPRMAFTGFASRFKAPTIDEGFQDITELDFEFKGTDEERSIWGKFWV